MGAMFSLNVTLSAAVSKADPAAKRASERTSIPAAMIFLDSGTHICRALEPRLPHYFRDFHLVICVPFLAAHPLRHPMPCVLAPLPHGFRVLPAHNRKPLAIVGPIALDVD